MVSDEQVAEDYPGSITEAPTCGCADDSSSTEADEQRPVDRIAVAADGSTKATGCDCSDSRSIDMESSNSEDKQLVGKPEGASSNKNEEEQAESPLILDPESFDFEKVRCD